MSFRPSGHRFEADTPCCRAGVAHQARSPDFQNTSLRLRKTITQEERLKSAIILPFTSFSDKLGLIALGMSTAVLVISHIVTKSRRSIVRVRQYQFLKGCRRHACSKSQRFRLISRLLLIFRHLSEKWRIVKGEYQLVSINKMFYAYPEEGRITGLHRGWESAMAKSNQRNSAIHVRNTMKRGPRLPHIMNA